MAILPHPAPELMNAVTDNARALTKPNDLNGVVRMLMARGSYGNE
jgi:hypothetical protein